MRLRLRNAELSWREIDGKTVLLDLRSSTYFRTNKTGTLLLRRLLDGCDRDSLTTALIAAHGLEAGRADRDVEAFLAELDRRGLLVRTDTL